MIIVNPEDSRSRGWLLSQLPTNSNDYMIQRFLRNRDKSRMSFQRLYFRRRRNLSSSQRADSFPTPVQVAATETSVLRTAGLSMRKAEYSASNLTWIKMSWYTFVVQDLAQRFADGRLSTEKILSASDEELAEMLIQVRGIGRVSTSSCSPRANELVSYHNVWLCHSGQASGQRSINTTWLDWWI